jgi:hypothetical protein
LGTAYDDFTFGLHASGIFKMTWTHFHPFFEGIRGIAVVGD